MTIKKNRISYNWLADSAYTMVWTSIFTTLLVISIQIFSQNKPFIQPLISINIFAILIPTFFIGLRPILSLFTIPDTLYVNHKGQLVTKESEVITHDKIQALEINQVGAGSGHLIYYKMTFNKVPSILKNKKRKSLILIEPYNIKHIFQTRTDLIDKLIDLGLDERKVKSKPFKTKHIWGIRDKFKK